MSSRLNIEVCTSHSGTGVEWSSLSYDKLARWYGVICQLPSLFTPKLMIGSAPSYNSQLHDYHREYRVLRIPYALLVISLRDV